MTLLALLAGLVLGFTLGILTIDKVLPSLKIKINALAVKLVALTTTKTA
jgi:hypothetical protein